MAPNIYSLIFVSRAWQYGISVMAAWPGGDKNDSFGRLATAGRACAAADGIRLGVRTYVVVVAAATVCSTMYVSIFTSGCYLEPNLKTLPFLLR